MHAVSDEVNTVFRHIRDKIRKIESALMLSFAVEVKQYGVLGITSFFHSLQLSSSCDIPCMLSVEGGVD